MFLHINIETSLFFLVLRAFFKSMLKFLENQLIPDELKFLQTPFSLRLDPFYSEHFQNLRFKNRG